MKYLIEWHEDIYSESSAKIIADHSSFDELFCADKGFSTSEIQQIKSLDINDEYRLSGVRIKRLGENDNDS